MKLTLGTPPVEIYGAYDTGSGLVWTQCTPCPGCYKPKNPMFDPLKSQTYNNIYCGSEQCKAFPFDSCSPQNLCVYNYGYYDTSVTYGVLASETATFNSTDREFVVRDFVFGCGHNSNLEIFDENEMGIIGFDRGPLSLISQIGNHFGGRRFSQCLVSSHVDHKIAGKINFGAEIEIFREGVVTTPLVSRETPYYYVILKGISVGNNFLPFNPSQQHSEGYMMIDSGTPPCHVPLELYNGLVEEMRSQIIGQESIGYDPRFAGLLCFRSDKFPEGPILTFHFEGADVQLMPTQTFFIVEEGVCCFGIDGVPEEP
ncbi:Aspartic proteinase CDR1 [Spatholobus suberectus]|nr:Aspartic proteinase CDR1 [Spatholobus suberectus]